MSLLFGFVYVSAAVFGLACEPPVTENNLEIAFLDVGHGSSVLLRTPDGRVCLVDGGPTFAGANDVCPVLDSLGITRLDYVFSTNYTDGRVGGLDEVIRYVGGAAAITEGCFDRGKTQGNPAYGEYVLAAGEKRRAIRLGETFELGDVTITCCARGGRVLDAKHRAPRSEEDRSVALLVSYSGFDLLLPGDLCAVEDQNRLDLGAELAEAAGPVELLAVPDFGSFGSVSFRFIQRLNPVASVLSSARGDSSVTERTMSQLTKRHRQLYLNQAPAVGLEPSVKTAHGDVWVTVGQGFYAVAGDTFRTYR